MNERVDYKNTVNHAIIPHHLDDLHTYSSDIPKLSIMSESNTGAVIKAEKDSQFEVTSTPYPTLQPNAVIIKASAAAINPVDWMVRDFAFVPLEYPTVLGTDVSGTVVEVGEEVKGIQVGQRVLA